MNVMINSGSQRAVFYEVIESILLSLITVNMWRRSTLSPRDECFEGNIFRENEEEKKCKQPMMDVVVVR